PQGLSDFALRDVENIGSFAHRQARPERLEDFVAGHDGVIYQIVKQVARQWAIPVQNRYAVRVDFAARQRIDLNLRSVSLLRREKFALGPKHRADALLDHCCPELARDVTAADHNLHVTRQAGRQTLKKRDNAFVYGQIVEVVQHEIAGLNFEVFQVG